MLLLLCDKGTVLLSPFPKTVSHSPQKRWQKNRDIPEKYGAEYIYVSSYERSSYGVDEEALAEMAEKVFENREAAIYRLSPAKEK